jgi:O-antigen ligase
MSEIIPIPAHSFGERYKISQVRGDAPSAEMGAFSFKLLIAFFFLLYSSLPLMFPVLDLVRPAQIIGGLALVVLLYEKVGARQSLDLVWPDGYLLVGFVAAAGLSVVGALWPSYALDAALNLVKMAVVYLLIVNTVTSENRLRTLLWVMVLCGLFPALGSLWYWHQGIKIEGRAKWIGMYANPNELGYSLVVLIPLAVALSRRLKLARRVLVWLVMAAFMTSIYLSYSRGSLIGLFAVLAYMGWRQKSKLARAGMIGVLVVGALAVPLYWSRGEGFNNLQEDTNLQERMTTYKVALAMYSEHPLLGVGINCSSVAWPLYAEANHLKNHKWLITHNTFLQALSETGTFGFLFLVSFFGAVIYRAWRAGRSNISGREGVSELLAALEIAFWGFVVCGLSGGYVMSWFPYLLAGLIGAAGRIAAEPNQAPQTAGFHDSSGRTTESAALPFKRRADQ